ncbi:MAG: hypothetical protein Q4P15_00525 [Propionibacteriaceae bacterium]|nr:hypothetical protein [Propionibacteriaceae bacterium]
MHHHLIGDRSQQHPERLRSTVNYQWAPLPEEMREPPPDLSWFQLSDAPPDGGEVVSIGAFCDLRVADPTTASVRFSVIEFVELSTGARVPIDERGFGIGYKSASSEVLDPATIETLESLTGFVLNTVLPDDDDDEEDHPWEWLAFQARERGVDISSEDIRSLEYRVVFSERVHEWLKR